MELHIKYKGNGVFIAPSFLDFFIFDTLLFHIFHIGEWNMLQDPFPFDSETDGLLTSHLQYEKIIQKRKKRSLEEDMKRIQSF